MGAVEPLDIHEKKVLKQRAKNLSIPLEGKGGECVQVLCFLSAKLPYALERSYISEVTALSHLTPLPGVPPFVLGIINRHGRIVAVFDLQSILGIATSPIAHNSTVIILKGATREFGLLADELTGFISIPVADLQSTLPNQSSTGTSFVESVTIDGIALLAAEKLLLDNSLVVEQSIGGVP